MVVASCWEPLADGPSGRPGIILDGYTTAYVPGAKATLTAYPWNGGSAASHIAWTVQLPNGSRMIGAPSIHASGRLYVPIEGRVEVIDEKPAFKIAYHAPGAGRDVYSLREVDGVIDPGRTSRLSRDPGDETEPSYARDPAVIAWVGDDAAGSRLAGTANGAGRERVDYPFAMASGERHTSPALSPVDDRTGRPLLPERKVQLAFTKDVAGHREVRFTQLPLPTTPVSSPGDINATDFARRQGLDPVAAATLTAPTLETVNPAFSPNGHKVAWVECRGSSGSVVVLHLDHSPVNIVRLGLPLASEQSGGCFTDFPAFSPDSRWIVVEWGGGLRGFELDGPRDFVTPPPGSTRSYHHPSWSPDGSEIAVTVKDPHGDWVGVLSASIYKSLSPPLAGPGAQQPSFHLSKLPPPHVVAVSGRPASAPGAQRPGASIDISGRGFDLVRPDDNVVYFTERCGAPRTPPRSSAHGSSRQPASGSSP